MLSYFLYVNISLTNTIRIPWYIMVGLRLDFGLWLDLFGLGCGMNESISQKRGEIQYLVVYIYIIPGTDTLYHTI